MTTARRVRWTLLGGLGLVVVGVGVWLGMSWTAAYDQAQALRSDVAVLRSAIDAGHWSQVLDDIAPTARSAAVLQESTEGTPWRLLEHLPVAGSTASATSTLADAVDSVLASAQPLVPLARRAVDGDLRAADGSWDLAALGAARPLVDELSRSLADAQAALARVELDGVREPVASAVADASDQLGAAGDALSGASVALDHLPSLLGAEGERTWLVLLQNPGEARGSGGFVGGYAVLTARDGTVAVREVGSSTDLTTSKIPISAADEDDRIMWGEYLTSWNDYNLSPDFPLVARLSAAGMRERGVDVDGVIAIDPAVVAALMASTGPVEVGGRTITASDVERFFLVDIYREIPDGVQRDAVSNQIVSAVLAEALTSTPDVLQLVRDLSAPLEQGRVHVWSADAGDEAWLAPTQVGGVLPDDPGHVVAVTSNNAAANKLDAFMATSVDYTVGCPAGAADRSRLQVTLRNDAPEHLSDASGYYRRLDRPDAPAGSTSMLVHLYLPVGADDETATIDGRPAQLYPEVKGERIVWWTVVDLDRGQERTIEVTFTEPAVDGSQPSVIAQPMAIPTVVSAGVAPGC